MLINFNGEHLNPHRVRKRIESNISSIIVWTRWKVFFPELTKWQIFDRRSKQEMDLIDQTPFPVSFVTPNHEHPHMSLVGPRFTKITFFAWPKLWSRYTSLKNGPFPASFLIYFRSLQTLIQCLQQINVKHYPFTTSQWDSNLWPLEHEPPHITTWPGLTSAHVTLSYIISN